MNHRLFFLAALALLLAAACSKEQPTRTTYGDASALTELMMGSWICDYCQWADSGAEADSLARAFVPDTAYEQPFFHVPVFDSAFGFYSWQDDLLLLGPDMRAELNGERGHWLAVDSTLHLGFGVTYTLQIVDATGSDILALRRRPEATAALHWRKLPEP